MENKSKDLAKSTIIIFFSKFLTQFLAIFILPLLTAKLNKNEYGTFDLISTYSWLVAAFMSLQLENGMFRFLIDYRNIKDKSKCIISSGFFLVIIQTIIVLFVYFMFSRFIRLENDIYVLIVSISVLILNIPLQISRGMGNNIAYAIGSIITGISNVIFCIIFIFFMKYTLIGIILANVLSNVLGGIYIVINEKLYKYCDYKSIDKQICSNLLKYSIPLMPNNISTWIISISDKIIISIILGVSANGIYAIITKFPTLLTHIFNVFNLAWTESASININEKDREEFFSKTINNIFCICSCICIMCIAVLPIAFDILIDSNYNEAYNYIPILIIATFFEILSGLLGSIYISLKLSRKLSVTTVCAAIFNIGINVLFMKKFGIIIACISTVISQIVACVWRIIEVKRRIHIRFDYKKYCFLFVLILIVICLYYKRSIFCGIISICITTMAIVYLNKEIIKSGVDIIKNKLGLI